MNFKLKIIICITLIAFFICGCGKLKHVRESEDLIYQPFDTTINANKSIKKLSELGLISKNDVDANDNITVLEGLKILFRITRDSRYHDLRSWYTLPETEHLDYLDEWDKLVLTSMWAEAVIQSEEFTSINLDGFLTEYEALNYITRLLGNTYGCVQIKTESYFTTKEQTYDVAFQKALIKDTSMTNSDEIISREDYFILVYRALYANLLRGNIAGTHDFKYIDLFSDGIYDLDTEDIIINNYNNPDLEWDKPKTDNKLKFLTMFLKDEYKGIDIKNTNIVIQGNEINPGIYTRINRKWTCESISLANQEQFEKNSYYLITSYENRFRKNEYNTVGYYLFKANETSNTIYDLDLYQIPKNIISRHIYDGVFEGGIHTDKIHIQEIQIEGDAVSGFTIYATPESSSIFEVIESSES